MSQEEEDSGCRERFTPTEVRHSTSQTHTNDKFNQRQPSMMIPYLAVELCSTNSRLLPVGRGEEGQAKDEGKRCIHHDGSNFLLKCVKFEFCDGVKSSTKIARSHH